MVTRSKVGVLTTVFLNSCSPLVEHVTATAALSSPEWAAAMRMGYDVLLKNKHLVIGSIALGFSSCWSMVGFKTQNLPRWFYSLT